MGHIETKPLFDRSSTELVHGLFSVELSASIQQSAQALNADPASMLKAAFALTLGRFNTNEIMPLNVYGENTLSVNLSAYESVAEIVQWFEQVNACEANNKTNRFVFAYLGEESRWTACEAKDVLAPIVSDETELAIAIVNDRSNGLYHTYWYSSSLAFNGALLKEMEAGFKQVLAQFCTDNEKELRSVHALSEERYQQLIVKTNETAFEFPDKCLFELFEQQALEQPDAPSLIFQGKTYSYNMLNKAANQLASVLIKKGAGEGKIIAVSIPKSDWFVISVMAIAKTGAAYLPIDPNYPESRVKMMLADIEPMLVVTTKSALNKEKLGNEDVLIVDDEDFQQALADASDANPSVGTTPDALFYAIFTSGSTGNPKAILLDHRGRTSNFLDFIRRFDIKPGDSLLGVSSISFDMSAFDVFGILASGATLVLNGDELDPIGWAETIVDYEISLWHSAPALFDLVLSALEDSGPHDEILRLTLLGGDWIPLDMQPRYKNISPDGIFISLGGASEVSMDSTIFQVDHVENHWRSIPYGRPMGNQKAYILDDALRPVPVGVAGQLFLGGVGVGNGYHKRDQLTAEKFLPDPFGAPGSRMYMTGDCTRWMPDGEIELLGRLDFQVKINGLRIELGEIEHAIGNIDGVLKAVVVRAGSMTDGQLVAFYTSEKPNEVTPSTIEQSIEDQLPSFMVPKQIISLDEFELSPNGKVDRSALMRKAEKIIGK